MLERDVLTRMAIEKKKMVQELITKFLGHDPEADDLKHFKIMHSLRESEVYYDGVLIGTVKSEKPDESFM